MFNSYVCLPEGSCCWYLLMMWCLINSTYMYWLLSLHFFSYNHCIRGNIVFITACHCISLHVYIIYMCITIDYVCIYIYIHIQYICINIHIYTGLYRVIQEYIRSIWRLFDIHKRSADQAFATADGSQLDLKWKLWTCCISVVSCLWML
jgi:hypothetical protein